MFDVESYLRRESELIDARLREWMPPESTRPAALHEAMRYSVFAGGKRLRPALCLAAAEAAGGGREAAMASALALEVLHTYTLIHDDLPCMDDDVLRRNKPTCHVVFGEATALLAGDALLTLAFEWLARTAAPPPHPPGQLAAELALAAGSRGVIGGQVEDLAGEGTEPTADAVQYIHEHKTAALIRAAVRMGAIAAGAHGSELDAFGRYGGNLGLAFQVTDDILNATSDAAKLGKPTGTDAARRKMTYVAVFGVEESRRRAEALIAEGMAGLRAAGRLTAPLEGLAEFVVSRAR